MLLVLHHVGRRSWVGSVVDLLYRPRIVVVPPEFGGADVARAHCVFARRRRSDALPVLVVLPVSRLRCSSHPVVPVVAVPPSGLRLHVAK